MKAISWDVAILAAFGLLLAYSLLIRRHKALGMLVSVYIAYFVAASWGERISQLFSGDRVLFNQVWIKANATPYVVEGVLLVLFTLLLSSFIKLGGKRSRYTTLEVVVYSLCTISVGTLFILLFLPDPIRMSVLKSSEIVPYIYQWRDILLIVPVVAMVYFGIYSNEDY